MTDEEYERIEWLIAKSRCRVQSTWAENFIDSIEQQLLDGREHLSPRQMECLERIAD